MTVEQIIENYKKLCTGLTPVGNLLPRDFKVINDLVRFSEEEKSITDDQIISAFKKANESDFLCGKKTTFKADIKWMCNPVNLEKINNGKYDDHKRSQKSLEQRIESHEYDFKELERELHKNNMIKLGKIRNDKDHQEWLENYWYKKYPNLRPWLEIIKDKC